MQRRAFLTLSFLLLSSHLHGAQTPPSAPESSVKITARAERESAIYKKSEDVLFNIHVTHSGTLVASGEVEWSLLKDGLPLNLQGKASLENGKASVTGKLDEPGFLQLRVSYRETPKEKPLTALAGAGIDPAKIQGSLPVPDDFDSFWSSQKALLSKVPLSPELTPVSQPNKSVEAFDLQAPCIGAPVSGYLAIPAQAKPKSLPIILTVHGAGVRGSSLGSATGWASKGFLAMDINAHGIPNGKPDEFYKGLLEGALKTYRYDGRESRDTSYFRGMFLRLVRAIDVLTARPEWDGKSVVVYGSSQGGYQAIVAAGLDPRVTFFSAGVPAGCDHSGMVANRIAGWPKIVPTIDSGKPDAQILEAARYIDAANFASRIKASGCCFTVGFIDTTCPPSSVYAAYNRVPVAKHIENDILSGHAQSNKSSAAMADAVLKHIEQQKSR
jgi:cephalosporin-C deacetylase-like acetyl esterase